MNGVEMKVEMARVNIGLILLLDTTSVGSWLDQGRFKLGSIFVVQNSPSQKPASGEEAGSDGDDSVVKNDQDPYFEPIVPLPDIVEVRTGEEDEEISTYGG